MDRPAALVFLVRFHPRFLERGSFPLLRSRDANWPSLPPSLRLMMYDVWLFGPEVPPFPVDECICITDRVGRPSGKSAATMNRERQTEEEANPDKRQKRTENEKVEILAF